MFDIVAQLVFYSGVLPINFTNCSYGAALRDGTSGLQEVMHLKLGR
jgi:hypothetical protein